MRVRYRLFDLLFGVCHLFSGRFKTPAKHHGKIKDWPDPSVPDSDIREILDHWAAQQSIAWGIARCLAWFNTVWAICWLIKK